MLSAFDLKRLYVTIPQLLEKKLSAGAQVAQMEINAFALIDSLGYRRLPSPCHQVMELSTATNMLKYHCGSSSTGDVG